MNVRLTVIGSSPAWPNPGSAQSGYLVESGAEPRRSLLLDCGPGVLGTAPRERSHARQRGGDHPLPPRPLGRPRPVGLAQRLRPDGRAHPVQRVAPARRPLAAGRLRGHLREPGHVRLRVRTPRVRAGTPFEAGRLRGRGAPPTALHDGGVRLPGPGGRQAARLLRRLGPTEELSALARGADLFVCEATLAASDKDGEPRGHLSADEALAAADGPILLTHRPVELPIPDGRPRSRRTGSWSRSPADRLFDTPERGPHHPMSPFLVTGFWTSTVKTNHWRWFVESWWPR